jgi:UPF0042 nucleotide-binding protein
VVSDVRSGTLFDEFNLTVKSLKQSNIDFVILYLDCTNEQLLNRFKEVRRTHPLEDRYSLKNAIATERRKLTPIREKATWVIDTSHLNVKKLQQIILSTITGQQTARVVQFKFVSFGFKYGPPRDADFMFDVRFLPNPFYIEELKDKNGETDDVYNYVMSSETAQNFFIKITELLNMTIESFVETGKFSITVAIGCTGGHHRSVAFVRRLAEYFNNKNRHVTKIHRDLQKPV